MNMEILVLIKQVPATEAAVEIADDKVSIKKDKLNWVLNPYDEIAVEEALRIKAAHGGRVTVLSVGPEKAEEAIRTAYAMGADQGLRVDVPQYGLLDALTTAKVIHAALKDARFDLIIAGQRAVDDDNFQVGSAVAELYSMPSISMVFKQEISNGKIICHKTIDGGFAKIEAPLPVLVTTQRGLNEPRYTSLPGIMQAKKKSIDVKTLSEIGIGTGEIEHQKVKIKELKFPPQRKKGRIIEGGSVKAKVATLVRALREETGVI